MLRLCTERAALESKIHFPPAHYLFIRTSRYIRFLLQPHQCLGTSLTRPFVRLGETIVSYFCRDDSKGYLFVLLITASLRHIKHVSWAMQHVFSLSARALSHQGERPPVPLLKIYWQLYCIWSNFSNYHSVPDNFKRHRRERHVPYCGRSTHPGKDLNSSKALDCWTTALPRDNCHGTHFSRKARPSVNETLWLKETSRPLTIYDHRSDSIRI